MSKYSKKIKLFFKNKANNYGIFIISFSICFCIYRFDCFKIIYSIKVYFNNLCNSDYIDKMLQSTITCASILLGFSGTLFSHLLNAKQKIDSENNKNESKISWVFKVVNNSTFSNVVLTSVITCICLIILSLIMLTCDIMAPEIQNFFSYFWLFALINFVYYEITIYRLFISLLFNNENEINPMTVKENPNDIDECMSILEDSQENTENHS